MPGPTGTKPSSLASPIPRTTQEEDLDSLLAQLEVAPQQTKNQATEPQLPTGNQGGLAETVGGAVEKLPQIGEETLESLLDQLGTSSQEPPTQFAEFPTVQLTPEETDLTKDLGNFWLRTKLSFGTTDQEKANILANEFGTANVRITDKGVMWKRPDETKFKPYDSSDKTFNDFTADIARIALESAIDIPLRAVGTAVGAIGGATAGTAAAPGPGTVGGAVAGGLAGEAIAGAVSSIAATAAGDFVAQSILDIKRDPERSRALEFGVAGTLGAAVPMVAQKVVKPAVAKAIASGPVDEVIGKINKWTSKVFEKRAGKHEILAGNPIYTKAAIEETESNVAMLKKAGFVKQDGDLAFLNASQYDPKNPALASLSAEVKDMPQYAEAIRHQGNVLNDSYESLAKQVGQLTGKDLGTENLGKTILDIDRAQGTLIGDFRKEAIKSSAGKEMPVTQLKAKLTDFKTTLGGEFSEITPMQVAQTFPGLTLQQARILKNTLVNFDEAAKSGNMPMNTLVGSLALAKRQVDSALPNINSKSLGIQLLQLKNALVDDELNAIESSIGGKAKESFMAAKQRLFDIKSSREKITSLTEDNDFSRIALTKKLFLSPTTNLSNIRAVKTIIQTEKPAVWDNLKGEFLLQLKSAHKKSDGSIDWTGVRKQFEGLGDEVISEIFDKENRTLVKGFMQVADNANRALVKPIAPKAKESLVKQIYLLAANTLATTKATAAAGIIGDIGGKDKVIQKLLTEQGVADILAKVKDPVKKAWLTEVLKTNMQRFTETSIRREMIEE